MHTHRWVQPECCNRVFNILLSRGLCRELEAALPSPTGHQHLRDEGFGAVLHCSCCLEGDWLIPRLPGRAGCQGTAWPCHICWCQQCWQQLSRSRTCAPLCSLKVMPCLGWEGTLTGKGQLFVVTSASGGSIWLLFADLWV